MATASLERTTSTAPTLTTKATISYWCKRGRMSGWNNGAIAGGHDSGNTANNNWQCGFIDTDKFYLWNNGVSMNLISTRRARDTSAWYHVVWTLDSTQSTAADRAKLYINGVQETVFDTANYPTQNGNFDIFRNGNAFRVGKYINTSGSDYWYDGCLSHVHFIDGTTYQASTFGQTDATTGEWSINANPTVNYGNNGVFILKNDNSNLDRSGNGLNFTMGGTVTKTEDCPSNIFCTFNSLTPVPSSSYANGNTKATDGAGAHKAFYGTLGFTSGKYYWEAKAVSGQKFTIGISDVENYINYTQVTNTNVIIGESSNSYGNGDAIGWYYNTLNKNGSAVASNIHTIVQNDIMMIAVDADNGKIYYGVNGTWRVANSTTFNASNHDTTFTTGKTYAPAFSAESCGWEANFGNGYFGTTAISSAGTNASNLGIFEYDVPSGYAALCTKGLNE
mgnify:CR=1 FL=1